MKHGSLFNGIGGFQLAASWLGWENVFSCEIDDFCNRITKYHFPNCKQHYDIKKTDFRKYNGQIDILTGGFPCQPFSVAGKRLGTEDNRNLWGEMYRAITEIQPSWVLAENVPGIINWNEGVVFEQVHTDLENAGYEEQAFIIPAASVDAPHRRERVWFVAYSESIGRSKRNRTKTYNNKWETTKHKQNGSEVWNRNTTISRTRTSSNCPNARAESVQQRRKDRIYEFKDVANANSTTKQRKYKCEQREEKPYRRNSTINKTNWQNFPTQPPICGRDDGIPRELDGITFPKWRRESIKAYGNAIVPQVAFQIFKAIQDYETIHN